MSCGNPNPIEWDVNERGCNICTSHALRRGYPSKKVYRDGKWTSINVVKYLWEQVNGPVSEGLGLLHSCDTPACINLEHVRPGTQVDNVSDRHVRGRDPNVNGERNPNVKLTKDGVRFIRENKLPNGLCLSSVELARRFNVTSCSIRLITNYKTWRRLG